MIIDLKRAYLKISVPSRGYLYLYPCPLHPAYILRLGVHLRRKTFLSFISVDTGLHIRKKPVFIGHGAKQVFYWALHTACRRVTAAGAIKKAATLSLTQFDPFPYRTVFHYIACIYRYGVIHLGLCPLHVHV